jgi:dTDP-4-amino-4,6-dideoxygalactose transaminase
MQIKIFTPPKFSKQKLDINYLNNLTNKNWQYSANGRSSIYHILKGLNIKKILIPVYICETVLEPLKKLKIEPIFYDIDIKDLNPSLESIEFLSKKFNIKALLVASMYGNPANLVEIEKFCKANNIFLIDDGAQSFGAKLDNRYIGTFGNAGFFSFSTGKPTAGHMGSFFWSEKDIQIKRTKHCLVHYFRWLDFYYNRYKIYDNTSKIVKKVVNLFSRLQLKLIDIIDDDICEFEKEILGGILTNSFAFREKYYNEFLSLFKKNDYFRVVENKRGTPNRHKFILIFQNRGIAKFFLEYMDRCSIYASNGYKLLSNNLKELPNAKEIDGKVVELPIEENQERMEYLFKKVKEFEYKNS